MTATEVDFSPMQKQSGNPWNIGNFRNSVNSPVVGQARAKSEGKTLGRASKTTAEQRADIIAKYAAGESISAPARL